MTFNARHEAARPASGTMQIWRVLALAVLLVFALAPRAYAQETPFKDEELDQMLAPIALYPDSLLAQVLMASTYPADFAEAVAWSKAHPDDKGDAAIAKVDSQAWEASVKSLVAFPQVLAMMGAKPEHVQRLGDAFLADPARVMDRVQFLRKKAQDAGNLKSNEQQKVSATTEASKQIIIIEPAQPTTVYVPAYQPTVYGAWGYPAYPPYYYPPPPYYYPPGGAFVAGIFWGAAIVGISNGLWGGANWGGGNVNINVNKYNNVNVNNKISGNNNNFNHNPERRGDVPYRDNKSQSQYGKKQAEGAKDREAYRGKDGRDANSAAGRDKPQAADRDGANAAARDSGRSSADRAGGAGDRGGGSPNALTGVQNSSASRASSSRGQASSSSMRSSGGGARAGGGGGGRGGGRR